MYHAVSDPSHDVRYPELYVSPADFRAQVAWLAGHGYHAVTLEAVYRHWRHGTRLPAHPLVFSFDDGYRSQVATAAPVLGRRHWVGVVNLTVRNTTDRFGLPPPAVRRLLAAGWEVDAHTLTHRDLTQVDAATLAHEVAGSRRALQRMFHVPVDFFCYPAGRFDARVVEAVRAAGFVGATTEVYGLATPSDMFRLDRVRVSRSDGVTGLAAKLRALGAPA
jgi:peptidoglycan/xylan/chitin deacetylase (PgdA/CDA1 family)